tara:strand:- start:231 stop:809 length:579 start_codon:yes stop_codon:yes gene_type:complete
MGREPLLVAPFDAELFGHWWYEGPIFLSELFKNVEKYELKLTCLKDFLVSNSSIQLCSPSPSSWGAGGYHSYWLDDSNSWVVIEWEKASKTMIECCSLSTLNKYQKRILSQAARELLLCQSSDWSFILKSGTTTQLANERIKTHLNRFWHLINTLNKEKSNSDQNYLKQIESEDPLFPLICIRDWAEESSCF